MGAAERVRRGRIEVVKRWLCDHVVPQSGVLMSPYGMAEAIVDLVEKEALAEQVRQGEALSTVEVPF